MTAEAADDLASPSASNCKWCPFKLFCNPFWKTATAAWSEELDGAAIEGALDAPPIAIHGGAAVAVSLNIQTGSEAPSRVQLAPLHPNMQLAGTIAAGDRVRLTGLELGLMAASFHLSVLFSHELTTCRQSALSINRK